MYLLKVISQRYGSADPDPDPKQSFMDPPIMGPYLLWRQEDADADNNPPDQLEVAGEGVLVHLLLPTRISNHKHKKDNIVQCCGSDG
jgi:hypothetical protein